MTKVEYQIEISAPNEKVYEYYTNPDNIREAWPQDIVKQSETLAFPTNSTTISIITL